MKTFVKLLATIVGKAPALAIIGVLALTALFGAFAPQLVQTTGIEVFVPDNAELRALATIEERFGTSETTVQVVIESDDGDVITACAQACPSGALTFGNVKDGTSRVAIAKQDPRGYHMLEDTNVRPAVTYLAKVLHRTEA